MRGKLSSRMMWLVMLGLLMSCQSRAGDGPLPTLAVLAEPTQVRDSRPVPTMLPPTPAPTIALSSTDVPTTSPTLTASATITDTPTHTATNEPPATFNPDRPIANLLSIARSATVLPTTPDSSLLLTLTPLSPSPQQDATLPACPVYPVGDFGTVFYDRPDLAAALGCPQSDFTMTLAAAVQNFEQGFMLWLDEQPGQIYAFFDVLGSYLRYPDTFNAASDPETIGAAPPPGLLAPVRGFGKVWQANAAVQDGLGYATAPETGASAQVLRFANGQMIALEGRPQVLVLLRDRQLSGGAWTTVAGN